MKELRELKLEELTAEQKLGIVLTAHVGKLEDVDFVVEMIKAHSLGGVWVVPSIKDRDEAIRRIKEAADYPILIMCDAESGMGEYMIGHHNALGFADKEELAYVFGKLTAITARSRGYNVICNPVLDMTKCNATCGAVVRSIGHDKYRVASLAAAEIQGMHDGGVLAVGKHYPGTAKSSIDIDAHMGETFSDETEQELLDYNLYPYIELTKAGLLDGVMLSHACFTTIDPDHPSSISPKVIDILRRQGFSGFAISDALSMMGVVAKFGWRDSVGLAVANACDIALPYNETSSAIPYQALVDCYNEGMISDERLNEAAGRVLAAQHKTLGEPKFTEITDEDIKLFKRISTESVYVKTDKGLEMSLKRDGRYYFAVLTPTEADLTTQRAIQVDTMNKGWYQPTKIKDRLLELFPNSKVGFVTEFPTRPNIVEILEDSLGYEDTIFITFFRTQAYIGLERFTPRIISLITAMQVSNRVSTVVHLGNPYVLEELSHIPRLIISTASYDGSMAALDTLAGINNPSGTLPHNVKLK